MMRAVWVAVIAAACAPARDARDDPAVRAAIAEAWREHLVAAKRKDAATIGRIYADDVVYAVPPGPEVRGRAAIDAMEAEGLAKADVLEVKHATEALLAYGDVAYELGTVAGDVRPRGGTASVVTFRYMACWRRQPDGTWRIQLLSGEPE